jgi:hypothetical protein
MSGAICQRGACPAPDLWSSGALPGQSGPVKSQSFPTGVIVANYYPDGAVKTGDFQLAEPSEAELERRRNLT